MRTRSFRTFPRLCARDARVNCKNTHTHTHADDFYFRFDRRRRRRRRVLRAAVVVVAVCVCMCVYAVIWRVDVCARALVEFVWLWQPTNRLFTRGAVRRHREMRLRACVEYRVSDDFLNGCVCTRDLDAITFTLHDAANRSALCSRAGGRRRRRRLHNDLYGNGKRDRVSLPHFLHLLHARAEPSRFQPTVHSPLGAQLCESC